MENFLFTITALSVSVFLFGVETAFTYSDKTRIELDKKNKNIRTTILELFFNNSGLFLHIIHIGNVFAIVAFAFKISQFTHPYLSSLFYNKSVIIAVQIMLSTILASSIIIVLAKTVFKINPNLFLKTFSIPLFFIYVILYPIAIISIKISRYFLSIFGLNRLKKYKDMHELLATINPFIEQTEIAERKDKANNTDSDVKLFQNALDFSKIKLKNCIVPRTEIVAVSKDSELNDLINKFTESGNSKILVFNENIDNILGYIDSAELFNDAENWKKRIKPMPIVPETMGASKLMNLFIQKKKNIAVVVDEFGGTAGIVTLEDIMEEIFGEIEDEHDTKEYIAKKISEKEYILSGRLEIDTINQQFNLNLPESDKYITIAGLILYFHEKLPKINEIINIDNFKFQVIKVTKNKIELIKMSL